MCCEECVCYKWACSVALVVWLWVVGVGLVLLCDLRILGMYLSLLVFAGFVVCFLWFLDTLFRLVRLLWNDGF